MKHNVLLQMGNNITCAIDPTTLAPTLSLPSSFDPGWKMLKYRFAFRVFEFGLNHYTLNFAAKPLKLHTHGFMDTTAGEGTLSKHTYFVNGELISFILLLVMVIVLSLLPLHFKTSHTF